MYKSPARSEEGEKIKLDIIRFELYCVDERLVHQVVVDSVECTCILSVQGCIMEGGFYCTLVRIANDVVPTSPQRPLPVPDGRTGTAERELLTLRHGDRLSFFHYTPHSQLPQ